MRVIQFSDCHLFADAQECGYDDINPYSSLQDIIELTVSCNPDAVVITGDISGDDSEQSYHHFMNLMQGLPVSIPWRVLPGNHDQNEHFDNLLGNLMLQPGKPWVFKHWHLHGLDTRYQGTKGWVYDQQLAQLDLAIARSPGAHHVVALHHHVIPTQSWMDTHALVNADRLLSWLDEQTNVPIVVHGHIHNDQQAKHHHSHIMGVPSTSWQFKCQDTFATENLSPGLRIMDLENNGQWQTTIRRLP